MLLVIDNYDSFVHNVARYFEQLGQQTHTVRNDSIDPERVRQLAPRAIVLSPGPCSPAEAGCCIDLVRQLHRQIPILGICLGHQAIAAAFGGRVVRSEFPRHGQSSPIVHQGHALFAGMPNPFQGARYHSLIVDEPALPAELEVVARTPEGTIMALVHRRWPTVGVQFHPESVLTQGGYQLLANFLRLAGLSPGDSLPQLESPEQAEVAATLPPHYHPLTF